jgi:hypothetical protein
MAIMSLRAYARHRKCDLKAVQKAISAGRISANEDGQIDSEAADRDWARNTRAYTTSKVALDDEDSFGQSQYSRARAVREHYQARLAKLDFDERTGSLVSKDEVQISAFNVARECRDHMLNIPDRLAAMVAAEPDAAKCYEILSTEIRKALDAFANANG